MEEIRYDLGILGGGQLGKMLLQVAANYPITTAVLDPNPNCSSRHFCHYFQTGYYKNYEDVMSFGRQCKFLTIEIENVNIEALRELKAIGVQVYPDPDIISIFIDKGIQKSFYKHIDVPTAEVVVLKDKDSIKEYQALLPAYQKTCKAGYDGKGVKFIESLHDIESAFESDFILEKAIANAKELSVIVAHNGSEDDPICFPAVEMVANSTLNLLHYLLYPAQLPSEVLNQADSIAKKIAKEINLRGILAVEFLISESIVFVNESAPIPHNSGHQTIEGMSISQYDMLLRAIIGYPLTQPIPTHPYSAMVNLIGSEGNFDDNNLQETLSTPLLFWHDYGKKTKIGRKMGHITVLAETQQELNTKINKSKLFNYYCLPNEH